MEHSDRPEVAGPASRNQEMRFRHNEIPDDVWNQDKAHRDTIRLVLKLRHVPDRHGPIPEIEIQWRQIGQFATFGFINCLP